MWKEGQDKHNTGTILVQQIVLTPPACNIASTAGIVLRLWWCMSCWSCRSV